MRAFLSLHIPVIVAAFLPLDVYSEQYANQIVIEPVESSVSSIPVNPTLLAQRDLFLDVLQQIRMGRKTGLEDIKKKLKNYPLYPYLEYEQLTFRMSSADNDRISAFIETYKNTPLSEDLMTAWLTHLGRKQLWYRYSQTYSPEFRSTTLACYNGYAQYRLGDRQSAFNVAEDLWLVDHSQVDACDPLFDAWKQAGKLSPDIAWKRFTISLNGNNSRLAKYLTRYMSNEGRTRANFYRRVYSNPALISRYAEFREDSSENNTFILKTLAKLARSDALSALEHFRQYSKTHSFSEKETDQLQLRLAINIALQEDEADYLKTLPESVLRNPDYVESLIRNQLKHGNWEQVAASLTLLPDKTADDSRWQYWRARAIVETGNNARYPEAYAILDKLSGERSFYGFLAADLLNREYELQHARYPMNPGYLFTIEQLPGIQRALELYAINEWRSARREWLYVTRNFSREEYLAAAEIAKNRGWHKQAIQSMIEARAWDDLVTRFPLAYQDYFTQESASQEIPVQWAMAIARQESAFMPDAQSTAGALGLMQLLPSTARLTARKSGIRYKSSRDLLQPEYNIKLGTRYLAIMMERFNNNRVLASAAYNAGPGRAEKWQNKSLPLDVWVEIIPFNETRQYVQNVLMYSVIYGHHLDQKLPLITTHEQQDFNKVIFELSDQESLVNELKLASKSAEKPRNL